MTDWKLKFDEISQQYEEFKRNFHQKCPNVI